MPTLNWIGKEAVVNHDKEVPFRLLKKIKAHSVGENSQNLIIHGDNLEALKALMPYYQGKIKVKEFENFPETITLSEEIPQEFNRNYYNKIDKLNKEEQKFVERLDLDTLPNIKFWIRNMEKKDPFYLQGWQKNKFYPDFIALTNTGNILVLEWKGEDRVSNEDTKYKEEVAKVWEQIGKGKLHFFLVHNANVEEVLIKIEQL